MGKTEAAEPSVSSLLQQVRKSVFNMSVPDSEGEKREKSALRKVSWKHNIIIAQTVKLA
jgi:hypothetical protein